MTYLASDHNTTTGACEFRHFCVESLVSLKRFGLTNKDRKDLRHVGGFASHELLCGFECPFVFHRNWENGKGVLMLLAQASDTVPSHIAMQGEVSFNCFHVIVDNHLELSDIEKVIRAGVSVESVPVSNIFDHGINWILVIKATWYANADPLISFIIHFSQISFGSPFQFRACKCSSHFCNFTLYN